MRFVFIAIAVFMVHLVMAQDDDLQEFEDGNVYLQGFVEIGSSVSVNGADVHALRINLLFGAGFNDWLFLGVGPGIRINRNLRSLPLNADIRIGNRVKEKAFFCALGGGVSVGSRKSYEVIGPAGHAEIGIRYNTKQKGAAIIYLGYEVYSAEVTEIRGTGSFRYSSFDLIDLHAITVGFGFSF